VQPVQASTAPVRHDGDDDDGRGAALMDVERARALLAAERQELERSLSRRGHQDDGENAGFQEPANLASELYIDELDEGLADDLRERLAAIERAEQRLAAGTYGLSVESGTPIPDERLEAFPAAERTVEEERARQGRGST
jgi:DnaK suppressor protein